MSSRCLSLLLALMLAGGASARELRVCADPNNLPFSNARGEGFENKLAELVARELNAELRYTWWAQRRGFIRHTLKAGLCDVVPGVPAQLESLRTTRPYYRSSYVFLSRDEGEPITSFDDERLRRVRVGVQLVGDDGSNPPPAHALAARGIVDNVRGYTVYGDYEQPNPPARIVEAVARGELDVAIVWGPLAGYFAALQKPSLRVVPVAPQRPLPQLPMQFDIAMGVRHADTALLRELEQVLDRRQVEIDALLMRYGVPVLPPGTGP